jgi:hypothetical protein
MDQNPAAKLTARTVGNADLNSKAAIHISAIFLSKP